MNPTEFNLEKLLRDVFAPKPGETVAVMVDLPHGAIEDNDDWKQRRFMAERWRAGFAALGCEVLPLVTFPATGAGNSDLPEQVQVGETSEALEDVMLRTRIAIAMTTYSATAPMSRIASRLGTLRVASMPGVLERMERSALAADYAEVARKAHLLQEALTGALGARIHFSTDDEVYFDLRFRRAMVDDGICHEGKKPFPLINLPSGEAFIVPYEGEREDIPSRTEGIIPVSLQGEHVRFIVSNNQIVEVGGVGEQARHMKNYFKIDPARANIAELGLGCNDQAIISGNVLEDEKAGMHWAYGRSEHLGGTVSPDAFVSADTVVHQDIVYAEGCPITITTLVIEYENGSDRLLIRDGKYLLEDQK